MCSTSKSAFALLGRKVLFDENSGVLRILVPEKVAALHWLALRPRSNLTPNAERTSLCCVEIIERDTICQYLHQRDLEPPEPCVVGETVFELLSDRALS